MIRLWRSCLILFCFVLFGFGAGVISFFIFPYITLKMPVERRKFAYAGVIHSSWKFFKDFLQKIKLIKVNCNDEARLANLSGKIIVASHPTFIDIVILIGLIPNSTCLAKKDTLKNPLFRNIVKSIYIINDIDIDDFKTETDKFLKEGFNIIIFPTGTRTKPDEDIKLHKGSAVISLHSNTAIVPVKITTDYPFLQKNQPIYDIGDRVVNYNIEVKDEISPQDFSHVSDIKARKEIMDIIKQEI